MSSATAFVRYRQAILERVKKNLVEALLPEIESRLINDSSSVCHIMEHDTILISFQYCFTPPSEYSELVRKHISTSFRIYMKLGCRFVDSDVKGTFRIL